MRYDSALQAIVDELGCIAVANVPADVGDIIDGWRKAKAENDKLHDALERQSEVLAGLRAEIATWKNGFTAANEALRFAAARVAELEAAQADDGDTTLICAGCGFAIDPDISWGQDQHAYHTKCLPTEGHTP